MKVILLQDIYKHGVAGEVVDVADGFARNYLIPRKMAVQATKSALKGHKALTERVEARRAQYENKLNEVARQIDGTELIFERRAASTGKLFGSVTNQEIADALLKATSIDINRRRISQQNIRELGTHEVTVRFGTEITPMLSVIIVREGELQDFLRAREAGELEETAEGAEAVEGEVEATAEANVEEQPEAVTEAVGEPETEDEAETNA